MSFRMEKTLKQEVARSHTNPHRDGLSSGGWNEIFIKVANQLDAVHSSANRISSSAESLGAVEYEARLSAAVQVLILYVDHIKVGFLSFLSAVVVNYSSFVFHVRSYCLTSNSKIVYSSLTDFCFVLKNKKAQMGKGASRTGGDQTDFKRKWCQRGTVFGSSSRSTASQW